MEGFPNWADSGCGCLVTALIIVLVLAGTMLVGGAFH